MFLEAIEDVRQAYLKLAYTECCEESKCAEFAATHTDASARNGGKIAHLNNAAARYGTKFARASLPTWRQGTNTAPASTATARDSLRHPMTKQDVCA